RRALAQLSLLDERRAPMVVVVFHLAVEALKTFGRLDLPGLLDRPDRAGAFAKRAGIAAFRASLEEGEEVQAVQNGQRRTQRAEEAAEGTLGEQADRQQSHRVEHIRPTADEDGGDRRLERLDLLGHGAGIRREEGEAYDDRQRSVLHAPQTLLKSLRRIPLRQAERPRQVGQQLLQGAERAKPSAEHAAPDED